MAHWGFWVGGVALAAIPAIHWLLLRRMFAVSGRITALIERVRHGSPEDETPMSQAEMIEAIRLATLEAMGDEAFDAPDAPSSDSDDGPSDESETSSPALPGRRPRTTAEHLVFFIAVVLGGLLSAWLSGTLQVAHELRTQVAAGLLSGVTLPVVLLLGGILVGFGTRMAAGCTSGHGLCGVSRLQKGSLLATAAFFGAGIATSFLLRAVL
jgi:hypothetical protein